VFQLVSIVDQLNGRAVAPGDSHPSAPRARDAAKR
jgi:hypothetical protein